MSIALATRLPGVRVTAAPARVPDALPRMDIAVFVGLASSGPVDTPVVVEDAVQFAAVFGQDAPLAWDAAAGAPATALLGPAVRAFFANGGQRCWIVRVASVAAETSRFVVPGLVALDPAAPLDSRQAALCARAPGSWADRLTLGARLAGTPQPLLATELSGPMPFVDCAGHRAGTGRNAALHLEQRGRPRSLRPLRGRPGRDPGAGLDSPPLADGAIRVGLSDAVWTTALESPSPDAPLTARLADGSPVPCIAALDGFGAARLTMAPPAAGAPQPGEVLTCESNPPFHDASWFLVQTVRIESSAASLPQDRLVLDGLLRRHLHTPPRMAGLMRCDRLGLELEAQDGSGETMRLSGLGFSPAHAAYVGAILDDAAYYAAPAAAQPTTQPAPGQRFPVCGEATDVRLMVPVFDTGAEGLVGGARHGDAPALVRDGLADFGAALFLDPDLADVAVDQLLDAADDIRYRAVITRPLRGIHVALGVDESFILEEATLIAVPDAALLGWAAHRDVDLAVRPLPIAAVPDPCAPETADFRNCSACEVTIKGLAAELTSPGDVLMTWQASDPDVLCVVEQADRDDFVGAREIYRGRARACPVEASSNAETYLRVRPQVEGQACDFGASVAIELRDHGQFRLRETADPRTVLDVHRALLRLAAARGDLFAVLSLPHGFGADEAIGHSARLSAIGHSLDVVPPLRPGEERALSYGALYHPWLVSQGPGGALELSSPDGAMTGILAKRTLQRGAWIAPANEPLKSVPALEAALPEVRRVALVEAGVNVISREPRGFLPLAAETLSLDPDYRQANVRRLMSLIRRVALRHGTGYVFEPNDATLRRTVERTFEGLMEDLFRRGAFAGRTPVTSYQVDCGPRVNPPANHELGRFVVEIRVAPSLPMRFLTVLLVQSGATLSAIEGAAR